MNTLSFPQITVSYKDADASKRVKIHSSKESYDILKTFYEDCMQHHEECWAMYLNRAGKLLGVSCISRSGIDCTVVDIRIVLQTALVSHASGIILSHNHPSGSTVASTQDNNLTSQLKKGCEAIGIVPTLVPGIEIFTYSSFFRVCLSFTTPLTVINSSSALSCAFIEVTPQANSIIRINPIVCLQSAFIFVLF